jgi:CRISPR-associated protein Csm4
METYLYRLKFKAPVHFGSTGIGLENTQESLSSDAITSALVNAFAVLGGADEVVQALRDDSSPCVLSSLFPFGARPQDGETVYALPCPLTKPRVEDARVFTLLGKDLKRVKYVQLQDFLAWIGDTPMDAEGLRKVLERSSVLAKRWDPVERQGWWATELRPRVALDRTNQNSSIWYCGTLHFSPEAGLYGLARISGDEWKDRLAAAFRLLGDLGLGGERTYGMGSFEFSGFEPLSGLWVSAMRSRGGKLVLLSNYYPTDEERSNLAARLEAWNIAEVRGYVVSGRKASSIKRKRLRMITEGSVVNQPVKGAMVDVTPEDSEALGLEHRVFRSGLAFLLPGGGAG